MAKKTWIRVAAVGACVVVLSALAAPQIKQVIKVVGVGAAVKQFGPDINRELNKLVKHKDTATMTTKVVPILSVGVGKSSAIGAAQVMGPKSAVEKGRSRGLAGSRPLR